MRSIIPVLFLLTPALLAADGAASAPRKKSSATSLLPDGSQLQDVILPRFDENRDLTGALKAAVITLINDEIMAGDKVVIEFSNPDGSTRGRINLATAVFYQVKGILQSADPVTLHSEQITGRGTGLYYSHQQGEGFLTGPATTVIKAPDETTTMNSSPSPLRTIALAGICLVAQSIAATPPEIAPEAKEALKADAVTRSAVHSDAARVAKMDLRADLDASTAATTKAREFLDQAELLAAASSGNEPEPAAKPLEVKPGPKDTLITCDGGIYFDADEGVLVYLKNVRVNDPQFALSGANELKIFLTKKPQDSKPKTESKPKTGQKPGPGMGLSGKFGDVDRMVATGAVRFLQKQPEAGKPPVEASGRIFTYRPETGNILLSGGYPWVRQGATYMRATEPDLTLRIEKSGSFVTEGKWDMGGSLEQNP